MGYRKPDPEIFVRAAEMMGVRPERAVFFDDSLKNVETAKSVGFKAFHTVNSPDKTIEILSEVLGF
jgi:HAD superfamily hydrolase (TIGR01509 family)